MTYKYNEGDQIMGFDAMYHTNKDPFHGRIVNQKRDEGNYYEIYGFFPYKNNLTKDGGQTIFAWEHCLSKYDEEKCKKIFFRASRIIQHRSEIENLTNEIEEILKGE